MKRLNHLVFGQHCQQLYDFIQLMRLNRPIGIYLLLWPALWALWLATAGLPSVQHLTVFILGTVLMRSAGCVINDYADRHFDGHVKRTANRPFACGRVTERAALITFAVLALFAFLLVLTTNTLTIGLAFGGLMLALLYPFAKRYTHLPQVVLGLAFSCSIPMAYAAVSNTVTVSTGLLFLANLLWTVAYDTQYAMVDRDDDLKIGLKSTAILFGKLDNRLIGLLQLFMLIALVLLGQHAQLSAFFYLSLLGAVGLFTYQQRLTHDRNREQCLQAFTNNHWVGAVIFVGIVSGTV